MMKKIIQLSTGLYNNSILTLTENDVLKIEIQGKKYPNSTYYFKAKNNSKEFNLKFIDNSIEINQKTLECGELKSKIVVMIEDKIIKEYSVENLIIQKLNNEIKIIPQFEEYKKIFNSLIENQNILIKEVKETQQDLFEKYKKIDEFENKINELHKLVYALCNIEEE